MTRARTWARAHGFKGGKADVGTKFIQLRQLSPSQCKGRVFRFTTFSKREGIQARVCR